MTDTHNYSFFGQKVGLIVQSSSKSEPFIFVRLIKSKYNGLWEKPSSGEGKVIKFSLEEMIWIIRVIKKEIVIWSSFHNFKNKKTQISFKWEEGEKGKFWIHIGSYSKVLEYAQLKILEMLLQHILDEKIEFATTMHPSIRRNSRTSSNTITQEEVITKRINIPNEIKHIKNNNKPVEIDRKIKNLNGAIKGETEKALLIQFDNDSELWIPKSTIHSNFNNTKNLIQNFIVHSWVLKKNKIIS